MQVVLIMFRDGGDKRSFSLVREVTTIGRREDCDFRIPLGDISRKHCRLINDGEVLKVQDLGSSNGTFVNGQRIQEHELTAGDTINLGTVSFVVQIDGVPAEEEIGSGRISQAISGADTSITDAPAPSDDFDPLTALNDPADDSSVVQLDESQLNRDLMAELGDSSVQERER